MSRKIIEAIEKLSGANKDHVSYVNATVDSVDLLNRNCDCTVVDGETEYDLPGVMLMAVLDDGILIEPVIGSTVKVIFSKKVEPCIVQYSEVNKITLITVDKVVFEDGSFGGLVKVGDLVTKLNNLENMINDFAGKFNSHTHILTLTSGTGTAAPTVAPETTTLTPTERNDIENTKVIHGE